MVTVACNPLMIRWAPEQGYIDYLTAADGAHYALRESVELLTGISGHYEETIRRAMLDVPSGTSIISSERNQTEPQIFTIKIC